MKKPNCKGARPVAILLGLIWSLIASSLIAKGMNSLEDLTLLGRSLFHVPWVSGTASTKARDGLGPLFNARSCQGCHRDLMAGRPLTSTGLVSRSLVFSLSSTHPLPLPVWQGFLPDPTYGHQLQTHGTAMDFEGLPQVSYVPQIETLAGGEFVELRNPIYHVSDLQYGPLQARISPRLAPNLRLAGLVDRVTVAAILALEDPKDKNNDGVSGRANWVWDHATGSLHLGRFGWKANQPNLRQQIAAALHQDMGLRTQLFPMQNCMDTQRGCKPENQGVEVSPQRLMALVTFLQSQTIAPPVSSHPGQKIFVQLGCQGCHVPTLTDAHGAPISLYSDLLLHDMGQALADTRSEFHALPREWRTPPLRGRASGANMGFLHDGRARTRQEAILWHGGEALTAKNAYRNLAAGQRKQLIDFLREL